MEQLNKNFWDKCMKLYPNSMQIFTAWIDNYKAKNNWNKLFNIGKPNYEERGWMHDPKYHDLPPAMQAGIWIEFAKEKDLMTRDIIAAAGEWAITIYYQIGWFENDIHDKKK